jgi:hypothetical protein
MLDAFPDIEPWGADNLEPARLIADAKSNVVLTNALGWVARALYGGGLEYGYRKSGPDGKAIFVQASIPQIDAVLHCSVIAEQLYRGFASMRVLGNAFPELILSKDRKSIVRIFYLDASYCRLSKMADDRGHEAVWVDANWALQLGRPNRKGAHIVPCVTMDGKGIEHEWIKAQDGWKYAIPGICMPTLGRSYYGEPEWASIRATGWLEYANQIPKFKAAYLRNASHIKYVIHVPISWWQWKYPDWESKTDAQRMELRKLEHERFDTFLTGVENAGKSIMLTYRDDPAFHAQGYSRWSIEALDRKVIEGILTDDVLETTQMLHTAAGVDGTLVGNSPGAKMGAGSGSDKREAFNIFMALTTFDQEMVLRPLEIMAAYNGFPGLKFRIGSRFLQLLSDVTPSNRNADAVQ